MRARQILIAAAAMSSAFSLGCVLLLLSGRWPAYLDLGPINNGWPLMSGGDDGIPDATLFHFVAWVLSELFGMGAGVAAVTWLCMFVFLAGAGFFYRSTGANGLAGVAALTVCSFVLTRYSHGQVAFLAGVGAALWALSLVENTGSKIRVFLFLFISGLLSPHAALVGLLAFVVMRKPRWHTLHAAAGTLLAVWPTVTYGYGVVGDAREFVASRPWYETLFLQSGFWHQDASTIGSLAVLALASGALWRFRSGVTSILYLWIGSCLAYSVARIAKNLLGESNAVAFLRDEHKIMVLGAVALSGLAGLFLESNKGALRVAVFLSLGFVGVWSVQSQNGFTLKETAALRALHDDVTGDVAVWPATRYNRLSDGGVIVQDAVSRVLENGTQDMGEHGVRARMSEWMASGGKKDFRPYFSTLVVIKHGQQGYGWLENVGNKRASDGELYGEYFEVIDLKDSDTSGRESGSAAIVLYYLIVPLLAFAFFKIRH